MQMNRTVRRLRRSIARFMVVILLGAPLAAFCGKCFASTMARDAAAATPERNCHDGRDTAPAWRPHATMPGSECPCDAWARSHAGVSAAVSINPFSDSGRVAAMPASGILNVSALDPREFAIRANSAAPHSLSPIRRYCIQIE